MTHSLTIPGIAACIAFTALAIGHLPTPIVIRSEFLFQEPPPVSAHAATIAESRDGLVAAWFGGSREGGRDVSIWVSRFQNNAWTRPAEVANGLQSDGTRYPCWNPVLFEWSAGALTLFYKVGANPATWWGMSMTSQDGGRTWSSPHRLPDGVLGPVKNKPVKLRDGTVISPSSTESRDNPPVWRVRFERSTDDGASWTVVGVPEPSTRIDAIQPAILQHTGGKLEAIGRTRSGRMFETWSSDAGQSWSALSLSSVVNPNAGLDAVTLRDGRQLLVYNHASNARTPLNVSISDDGHVWNDVLVLERDPGEFSYPAVIQSKDQLVHILYTWNRQRIKHVVIDLSR